MLHLWALDDHQKPLLINFGIASSIEEHGISLLALLTLGRLDLIRTGLGDLLSATMGSLRRKILASLSKYARICVTRWTIVRNDLNYL